MKNIKTIIEKIQSRNVRKQNQLVCIVSSCSVMCAEFNKFNTPGVFVNRARALVIIGVFPERLKPI